MAFKPAWSLGSEKGEIFTSDMPESGFKSVLNIISVPGDVEVSYVPSTAAVNYVCQPPGCAWKPAFFC